MWQNFFFWSATICSTGRHSPPLSIDLGGSRILLLGLELLDLLGLLVFFVSFLDLG
jgi:hypothetical protein